jgi:hypothetical protein
LARALFDLGETTGQVVTRDLRRAGTAWELSLAVSQMSSLKALRP